MEKNKDIIDGYACAIRITKLFENKLDEFVTLEFFREIAIQDVDEGVFYELNLAIKHVRNAQERLILNSLK